MRLIDADEYIIKLNNNIRIKTQDENFVKGLQRAREIAKNITPYELKEDDIYKAGYQDALDWVKEHLDEIQNKKKGIEEEP